MKKLLVIILLLVAGLAIIYFTPEPVTQWATYSYTPCEDFYISLGGCIDGYLETVSDHRSINTVYLALHFIGRIIVLGSLIYAAVLGAKNFIRYYKNLPDK